MNPIRCLPAPWLDNGGLSCKNADPHGLLRREGHCPNPPVYPALLKRWWPAGLPSSLFPESVVA